MKIFKYLQFIIVGIATIVFILALLGTVYAQSILVDDREDGHDLYGTQQISSKSVLVSNTRQDVKDFYTTTQIISDSGRVYYKEKEVPTFNLEMCVEMGMSKEDCISGITQAVLERSKETNEIQSVSYIEED